MDSSSSIWVDRDHVDSAHVARAVDEFETASGAHLHWVARHHLVGGSGQASDPFPRIEEHVGYLFGILYVPSNPNDTYAEFDELVFVATHDHVLGTYSRNARSSIDWPSLFETLSSDSVFSESDELGGRTIVRMLKTVVKQLVNDADNYTANIEDLARQLGLPLDSSDAEAALENLQTMSHRERRQLRQRADSVRDQIALQRAEVPLMRRVVTETETVLSRLAADEVDLATDVAGRPRELFTRELEIFVSDTYIDARHVSSLMDDIEYRLNVIRDYMKQLKDDENVSANRFTGAIASIMLLPTFIVGLYGQNFEKEKFFPELMWHYGYLYSWGLIVLVTIGQVWFFKRRKWL